MVMGGTGPMNSAKRRPWIDWIHTAQVQGNLVRDFVKWDDQPVRRRGDSVFDRCAAIAIAMSDPGGPVYLCFDVSRSGGARSKRNSAARSDTLSPAAPLQAESRCDQRSGAVIVDRRRIR